MIKDRKDPQGLGEPEQRERDLRLQAEKDRVARLFAQVSARQQVQQIRAYMDDVLASPGAVVGRAFEGDRYAWAGWVSSVPDQLDPLVPVSPEHDETLPDASRMDDALRPFNFATRPAEKGAGEERDDALPEPLDRNRPGNGRADRDGEEIPRSSESR